MSYRPRVFIGSSGSGKAIAKALEMNLQEGMECRLWYRDVFRPSRTTIEELEALARSEIDLAVLVLTPDDLRDRGSGPRQVARDNVIFEFGLFMGAMSRDRTFGVICRHCTIEVPTDLLGVTWVEYEHPHLKEQGFDPVDSLDRLKVATQAAAIEIAGSVASHVPARGAHEALRAYPMRGLVTRPEWNGIIRGSRDQLWLYGMAEMGYAEDDEVPSILRTAVNDGCDVRILLLDPEYKDIRRIDEDEGNPAGTLSSRIRAALSRFNAINIACESRIQIRLYEASPTVSLVRGDARMLATPYVRFIAGSNSPTLELRHIYQNGTFERYVLRFENVWVQAREV